MPKQDASIRINVDASGLQESLSMMRHQFEHLAENRRLFAAAVSAIAPAVHGLGEATTNGRDRRKTRAPRLLSRPAGGVRRAITFGEIPLD